jgi:guanylate kinase
MSKEQGLLLVVSAPSGAGKTTICKEILKILPHLRFSVSCTTRPPREVEQNGKDYYFISEDEFRNRITKGEFIEWAENYGYLYGTLKKEIKDFVDKNLDILLDIDPRGAKNLKKNYPEGVFVFILPPSTAILKERLKGRGSEKKDMIRIRLKKAIEEISENKWYDYVIFNDSVVTSTDIMEAIYVAEKSKRKRLKNKINNLFSVHSEMNSSKNGHE